MSLLSLCFRFLSSRFLFLSLSLLVMQVGAWMHGTQGQELVCFTNRMNDSC